MPERDQWIKRLKLPSDQLAILASQVNKICAIEPGNFRPERDLADLGNIVRNIDPYLSVRGHIHINIKLTSDEPDNHGGIFRSLTTLGKSVPVPSKDKREKDVIDLSYREGVGIGSYIAEKVAVKDNLSVLNFSHFMDPNNMNLSSLKPHSRITYDNQTFEPMQVERQVPRVRFGFLVTYNTFDVWKKE
jgi:hypothetical protein